MGQRAKGIPLVANLLAPSVDVVRVVVIQLTVGRAESGETRQGQLGVPGPSLAPKGPRSWYQGISVLKAIHHPSDLCPPPRVGGIQRWGGGGAKGGARASACSLTC